MKQWKNWRWIKKWAFIGGHHSIEQVEECRWHWPAEYWRTLLFIYSVMHDCIKDIIELLLANGANVDCEDRSTGTTALQMAIIRGNLLSTQTLVTHGADTRALSKVRDTDRCAAGHWWRSSCDSRWAVKQFNSWLPQQIRWFVRELFSSGIELRFM